MSKESGTVHDWSDNSDSSDGWQQKSIHSLEYTLVFGQEYMILKQSL